MARTRKDPRHRARESALQILYHWEVGRRDVDDAAETFFAFQWPNADPPDGELQGFATKLAEDTVERLDVDRSAHCRDGGAVAARTDGVVDRLILRMAICELLRDPGTPPAVVINEALELARTFSTEESVKFINGMLDAIRRKLSVDS
jgi:N utilization substance protein B